MYSSKNSIERGLVVYFHIILLQIRWSRIEEAWKGIKAITSKIRKGYRRQLHIVYLGHYKNTIYTCKYKILLHSIFTFINTNQP